MVCVPIRVDDCSLAKYIQNPGIRVDDYSLANYIQKYGDHPTSGPILEEIVTSYFDDDKPEHDGEDIKNGLLLQRLQEHKGKEHELLAKMKAKTAEAKSGKTTTAKQGDITFTVNVKDEN